MNAWVNVTTFPIKKFFYLVIFGEGKMCLNKLICIHPGTRFSGYVHDNQSKHWNRSYYMCQVTDLSALYVLAHLTSKILCEISTVITLRWHLRKLTTREIKKLIRCHTAREQGSRDSRSGSVAPESVHGTPFRDTQNTEHALHKISQCMLTEVNFTAENRTQRMKT